MVTCGRYDRYAHQNDACESHGQRREGFFVDHAREHNVEHDVHPRERHHHALQQPQSITFARWLVQR